LNGSTPIRAFTVQGTITSMVVASDGTLYVGVETPASGGGTATGSVYAFAPVPSGTAGTMTAPSRSIGPFTEIVGALATDDANQLYVALNPRGAGGTKVDVFAPQASGQAAPLRVLQNPIPQDDPAGNAIVGLALSSVTPP
jgi:hypothetical protein